MILSAGSLPKFRRVDARATSKSIGQTRNRPIARKNSGRSRSSPNRPSCCNLANSHNTIADIDHGFWESRRCSNWVRSPVRACTRTWVPRFITQVPISAGGEDVALHIDLSAQAAYEVSVASIVRNDSCNWFAVLGNDQAFGVEPIQHRQALLLEFGYPDGFHGSCWRWSVVVIDSVWSHYMATYPIQSRSCQGSCRARY